MPIHNTESVCWPGRGHPSSKQWKRHDAHERALRSRRTFFNAISKTQPDIDVYTFIDSIDGLGRVNSDDYPEAGMLEDATDALKTVKRVSFAQCHSIRPKPGM
jgi:hypothetical protein